jgi:RND family efflux transporter MFP subunit
MKTATLIPLVLIIGLTGCSDERPAQPATPHAAVAVNTVEAATREWPARYEATGTVRARSVAVLSAKWMGYVREVKAQVGDRVTEGELLVVLDARDLDVNSSRATAAREEVRSGIPEADSAVAGAKANLDLAQSTLRRMNELYQKKSISDQEFDEVGAKVKAAQAAFDMAMARRSQLDSRLALSEQEVRATDVARTYAEIRAPFAGIVTAKSVDPGNLAVPGAPLITLERDGYRFEASIEESKLTAIRAGQPVSVTLDGLGRSFEARVTETDPAVDAASRTWIAKIDLPATPALRSGMFGRAVFQLGSRSPLTIPLNAVAERGQLQSVFVADNGTARVRLITLGEKTASEAEVLSGLNAGERVIVPVPRDLADGDRIEVKP